VSGPANFRGTRALIEPANAAMVLIDYQSGLFQTLGDVPMPVLRANLTTLAQAATLASIPVITTASAPQGPGGTLIPEIRKYAPHAKYVPRHGEINAWDNSDFVAAVRVTGKWQLIVAGTITSVCVALPAIAAVSDGYQVFAVMDASGAYSKAAEAITLARIAQAGVVPMDIAAVCAELQQTWNRKDAAQWAEVYAAVFPKHQPRIESYATLGRRETLDVHGR
jgi:nicotinamidase-related amidase